jgi:nicotinate-nucleotide adenylyltransferase
MRNIIIFGGSFDPPHIGHVSIVTNILSFYPSQSYLPHSYRDMIAIVPCFEHAFNKKLVDFDHRMAMCKLAFEIFKEQISISSIEKTHDIKRTINLLKMMKKNYPESTIKLVIGSDNDISRWRDPEGIKQLSELIVFPRNGNLIPHISSTQLREMIKNENLEYRKWIPKGVCDYIEHHGLYK